MELQDDVLDQYLESMDPRIHRIVTAALRGDRSVVPALRETLEQALALFSDSKAVIDKAAAAIATAPEAERTSVMLRLMAPMQLMDELLAAAIAVPDPSFEPVLKALSKCVDHEGVREALAKVRAVMPANAETAKIKNLAVGGNGKTFGKRGLAKMVAENDVKGILDAVTESPIGELLEGIAEAIRQDQRHSCQSLVGSCHRYPEAEVLFVVRPWITDSDPCRREAVAVALSREGDDGVPPDRRAMDILFRLLTDRAPEVVAATLWAIAGRTSRAFTATDLERMRSLCERHASVKVRQAYSDIFFSPYVGHGPAPGALEAWCRMTRDADRKIRYDAVGRLALCFTDEESLGRSAATVKAALNVARTDTSANVRFATLGALTHLGENHVAQIEQELAGLADRLEHTNLEDRADDEDDGLELVGEMVNKPSRRYVAGLERIQSALQVADQFADAFDGLLEDCRQAEPASFLGRLLSV